MIIGKRGVPSGFLLPAGVVSVLAVLRTLQAAPADPWRWNLIPVRNGVELDPIPCVGASARVVFAGEKLDGIRVAGEAGATFDLWWANHAGDDLAALAPAKTAIVATRITVAGGAALAATLVDVRGLAAVAVALVNGDSVARTLTLDAADESGTVLAAGILTTAPAAGTSGIVYIGGAATAAVAPAKVRIAVPANAGAGPITVNVYGVPA